MLRITVTANYATHKKKTNLSNCNYERCAGQSTSSFLPPEVWWWRLHGAAAGACSELSTPYGPFLCWPQTLRLRAGLGPRQDPQCDAQPRHWAGSGSGRNPRSARKPGLGEMKEGQTWSWTRSCREEKWSCRKEELLLWIWTDWVSWRARGLIVLSPHCPDGGAAKVSIKSSCSTQQMRCVHISERTISCVTHCRSGGLIPPSMCRTDVHKLFGRKRFFWQQPLLKWNRIRV